MGEDGIGLDWIWGGEGLGHGGKNKGCAFFG